ncbi:ATP-binding cassette domain-containing protein [Vibrio alginolyticus]|jgi:ATP-binding cassette subfamily B protein/ATP-binding cassette subfamily B multidrug efflux pump|uniref:Multidrug resistance-like ATP-binding protein MdlA n=8 Tax=Vibrio harveyi group TaxID=717610 RepID=A0A1W6TBT0_VIBAL|nr:MULTISPECIES: ABC transporter transmembrane domain-containing protein [Vibrio]ARO98442.1 putative multidrug resistance ABC transporter ATP-binding/permease protein YheI [Vibrio alginolyticus]ARP03159.1 putative multidrug resistance ABC transporter ATP-binding/permease protein YheI [Vibrio alginolyticus]ARP08217.1 putative multidrug resistance ABC transporter ATP-binding/permease protein YheI [Vibrio alginolyticus]ARP13279.1 putative multidrug resistance ABC transporter ATP-binding/permease p
MRIFWQLRWYFQQKWRHYVGSILLFAVISALQLVPPKAVGIIVDGVVDNTLDTNTLILWLSGLTVLIFTIYGCRILWRIWLFGASWELGTILRNRLYRHLSTQPPRFFERYKTGDLMARGTNDVRNIVMTAGEGVLTAADSLITGIAVLIIMVTQVSWKLTVMALLPMPFLAIIIFFIVRILHQRFRVAQEAFSTMSDMTQESLNGVRMLRAFGLENQEQQRFEEVVDDTGEKNIAVARVDARFDPAIQLTIGLSFLLSVAAGAYLVDKGEITLGDLTAFTMYLGLMIWPMLAFAFLFNILERGSAAWNRLQEIFDEKPEIISGNKPIENKPLPLKIDIDDFHWSSDLPPALTEVNIELEPGKMLGVAGPVGSGKSTLLTLLLRQHDLENGSIKFGDVEIKDALLPQWRNRFAVVNQSPFLFSKSIFDNIALGNPNAEKEEVYRAAKLACIHDDIEKFPEGYQTEVGEKGITLSGGQKQRIAIARAMLLNAQVLVLDDALSAVDGRTEHQILKNLETYYRNQALIVIAHRLTALEAADEIIVLNHGHITERGQHSALLAHKGWYAEMFEYQKLEQAMEE